MILDAEVCSYEQLLEAAQEAVAGGVDIIQLRDKKGTAQDILGFSRRIKKIVKRKIPYIINDRVDLAKAAGASGVHLGQDDLSVRFARKELGADAIIGVSCQNLQQAFKAQQDSADYIGFGSVFKTLTKPDRSPMDLKILADVIKKIQIPVFAIGGIGIRNLELLKSLGVKRAAICREILKAKDIKATTQVLKNISPPDKLLVS